MTKPKFRLGHCDLAQKRPIRSRIGNVRFAKTGWWCAQSYANRSPCYLANIRVIFENNSELATKSVKKTCGTGISLILRQFDIREEQGAPNCRNTERAFDELGGGKRTHSDQESGPTSYGLIQALRENDVNVVDYKPKGEKEERLISQIDLFEGGSVLLPKEAPWLEEFVADYCPFPAAMTIRSMRWRRVWPGDARPGGGRLYSEGQPDTEAEPLSRHEIQRAGLQVAGPIEIFNLLVEPSGKFPIPSGKNKGFRPCPGTGAMQIAPAGFPGRLNGIAIFRCRTTSGSQGKSHQNLPESLDH